MAKTVAIVGTAENTRNGVLTSKADEIWTMNWFYLYDFIPRISRLFEMHPIWVTGRSKEPEHKKVRDHWKWMHKKHPFPIYTLLPLKAVPNSIPFPIQEVTEDIFGRRLLRGDKPSDFYASSVDYMLAMAIHEKFDVIELYGVEMGSQTEYRYQRESCAFFCGLAMGRGITVRLEPNSILMKQRRYGYGGGGFVISRQDLERMHHQFAEKLTNNLALLQHAEGFAAALREKGTPEELAIAEQKVMELHDEVVMATACEQLLSYQISHIDLDEPTIDIQNPIQTLALEDATVQKA